MLTLQEIKLLNLNYSNFLSTITKSEQALKSANAELNLFNANVTKYSEGVGNPQTNRYQVTEEEVQKSIENDPVVLKVTAEIGRYLARGVVAYFMTEAAGPLGLALSIAADDKIVAAYDEILVKQPAREFLYYQKNRQVPIQSFVPGDVLGGGDASGQMFFDMFDRMERKNQGNMSKPPVDDMGLSVGQNIIGKHMVDLVNFYYSKLNSSKSKQQKVSYKKKVRKPPKPKTTPDEDFGDETLNKVYNTTKSALELNNAKFDKSKLLIESINFENAYLQAFNKEIDYKKEIATLQEQMNKIQGDDLETMNKKLALQTKISELKKNDVNSFLTDESNKIENLDLKGSLLQVDEIMNALDGIQKRLNDGGLDVAIENSLLRSKKYYEALLSAKTERKPIDLIPVDQNKNPDDKYKKPKGPTPYETFVGVFSEVQKIGGGITGIMSTLKISTDSFIGKLISGFNTAVSLFQSVLQIAQGVGGLGSIFGTLFKGAIGFATGGPAGAAIAIGASAASGGGGGHALGGSVHSPYGISFETLSKSPLSGVSMPRNVPPRAEKQPINVIVQGTMSGQKFFSNEYPVYQNNLSSKRY